MAIRVGAVTRRLVVDVLVVDVLGVARVALVVRVPVLV
jgi:hypothetical protein